MDSPFHPSTACSAGGLPDEVEFDIEETGVEVPLCPYCGGTGGEPLDDFCTPCEHCDGEGTQWWLE